MKKDMLRLGATAIILCMAIGTFAACANGKPNRAEAVTYVSLSINPEVEFTVSGDNKVLSVKPVNADAEVLLAETNFEGMDIEAAAEQVVSLSAEAGYIDVDANETEVELTVINEDSNKKTKMENTLETRLNRYFDNNGIFGKVSKATLEEYGVQAAQLGVSVGHMKMILRAIDMNPTMTLEQLKAMPINELVKLIKASHGKGDLSHAIKAQLKIDKAALKVTYAELFTLDEEVTLLKAQIAAFTGAAEEKAVLESTLALKIARIVELKPLYEAELKVLMEKAKADTTALKEQQKADKIEKIEKNKDKIESHREGFKKNEKKVKEDIQNWRKGA
ncbi:MAG: hypothetical protein RR357_02775 [Clostridia bacterium]